METHCSECWWSTVANEQKNLYWCWHPLILNYMGEKYGKAAMLDGGSSCGRGIKEKPSYIPDGWGMKNETH